MIGKDYWRGMPTNIDAAMMHSNGKAYFFRGDQYYRFDFNTNRRDKKAKIGKTGWKGLAFARDTSADNDIKLKISLTRIHPHQVEDSDDIGDYSADQWLVYKAGNSIKTPIDRVVSIASKQPSLLHENNDGTTFAKPIGEFLMSSGTIDIKNGQAESKYVRGAGNVARQLHLREGQTKTINNSVVYNINPEEIRDKNAKFEIHTKLIELDNCGKEWYKPGLFDDGGCDKLNVSVGRRAEIDIFEVLKYLQNPSSFGPHYFSAAGGYHKYSSDNNVMKFRDDSGGALEGKIVLRTKSGDEKHDYWIRLELIQ